MAKEKARFIMKIAPGSGSMFSDAMILVDRETGVNYLFFQAASADGLTPLLDREGKPIITTVSDEE